MTEVEKIEQRSQMNPDPEQYTKAETEHRFAAALGRALTTPRTDQAETKVGKSKKKKPSR